jgi:hypothetical protein
VHGSTFARLAGAARVVTAPAGGIAVDATSPQDAAIGVRRQLV